MPNLNKKIENKAYCLKLMYLAIFILHPEVYLGLCYAFKVEIFLQKWLTTLSQ